MTLGHIFLLTSSPLLRLLFTQFSITFRKEISIQVVDDEEYEKNKSFFLELGEPKLVHSTSSDSGSWFAV